MKFHQVVEFLNDVVKHRLDVEFKNAASELEPFDFVTDESQLSAFVMENNLKGHELVVLFLALMPHFSPDFLAKLITEYLPNGGDFPEIRLQGINALGPPAADPAFTDEEIYQPTGERQHRDEEQPRQRNPASWAAQNDAHRNRDHNQCVEDGDGGGRKQM